MDTEQHTPLNESILHSQDEKLKTAEEVAEEAAEDFSQHRLSEAEQEIMECAADIFRKMRGVR